MRLDQIVRSTSFMGTSLCMSEQKVMVLRDGIPAPFERRRDGLERRSDGVSRRCCLGDGDGGRDEELFQPG